MNDKITITPIGGFGEVGKNTLLFEINKEIFIIDAGIKFSADDKDIDIILPDLEYIYFIKKKIILFLINKKKFTYNFNSCSEVLSTKINLIFFIPVMINDEIIFA